MVFGIAKSWPLGAAGVLALCGVAAASPWQRRDLSDSAAGVNVLRPDFRATDAGSATDVSLWDGRVVVRSSRLAPDDIAAYTAELDARLRSTFDPSAWRIPFTAASPLRVVATSSEGVDLSAVFSTSRLRNPVVAINLAGHPPAESASETIRNVAFFILRGYASEVSRDVLGASARALSLGDELLASDREELRESGAGAEHALSGATSELFAAVWIREMEKSAGADFVRRVWTDRIAHGDSALSAFSGEFRASGGDPSAALRRALVRLYASDEVFPEPSRLTDSDLESGALDASSPGALAWRFLNTVPPARGGWTVAWPEDAAPGVAIVHYDSALPNDVVAFSAGDRRTLPFSGVARIDWLVLGGEEAGSALAAPVEVVRESGFPLSGLAADARNEPGEGVVLSWTTASHRDLSGWAILRSELTPAGQVIRSAPESLPAQTEDHAGASYDFVDTAAIPGRFYRYDVWAVTSDGVMSRAFTTTLQAR